MTLANSTQYPKYYFAYGSNLDSARLGGRIGRHIATHEMQHGVLKEYALALNAEGACEKCNTHGVAKANVVACAGKAVEGIVYRIDNSTEHEKLRACEGYHRNPRQYDERDITVQIATREISCFVYIACQQRANLPAEPHYLNYIRKGKNLFSAQYCAQLEQMFDAMPIHSCA